MAHHVTASYHEDEGLFIPPLRTLGFNPQLTMNDSLLVQSYIEAYDISYPEALRRIECEVEELRQHLESDGHYELNDIGVLSLNEEGHLEFQPCEAGILTPVLYGLSSFEMRPIDAASAKATLMAEPLLVTVEPVSEQPAINESESEETVEVEMPASESQPKPQQEEAGDDDAIVIKMSWLRNAVAVAAAILAFFMIQTPVSNSLMQSEIQQSSVVAIKTNHEKKVQPMRPAQPAPSVEITKAAPKVEPSTEAKKTEEVKVQPVTASKEETKTLPAYCIVLASQTTLRHAEDFVGILAKDGYNEARIMDMRNTTKVRVVYGSYTTEEEAQQQLRQLRKQPSFKDAWVMHL